MSTERPIPTRKGMLKIIQKAPNIRNKALFSILYWSGRRISEILALTRNDIRKRKMEDGRMVFVARFKILKKKKELWIDTIVPQNPITELFYEYIYFLDRAQFTGKLFPITSQRVRQICTQMIPDTKLHWFRHVRCTHLGEDYTEGELMAYMGWDSLSTAKTYIHNQPEVQYRKQLREKIE